MKYTVITGASSGIGYETALEFAKRNKNLILVARRENELLKLKEKIKDINSNLDVVVKLCDLSVVKNSHDLYSSLKEYEIETWINNAGFGDFSSIAEMDLDKIEKMLNLNIESLTVLSTLFVKEYSEVEGTQLINIASAGGYNVVANAVTYCATKFYVSAFTEGLGKELIRLGSKMKAKVLAPAATETEFAIRARDDIEEFDYKKSVAKFHTSNEMAKFLLDLYDGDKIVGYVDGLTYEFSLRDPMHGHVER